MTTFSQYYALIPAAGVGARMGASIPKQYLMLNAQPVIAHTIRAFSDHPKIAHVFVVVSAGDEWADEMIGEMPNVTILRCGGETRRDSVLNGLFALTDVVKEEDRILVHDAARPGLTRVLIDTLIEEVGDDPAGGLLALPVADTIKKVENSRVSTVPREGMWLAQTPQMFPYALLKDALLQKTVVTDEASAVEAMGLSPRLVEGHICNAKLTRPSDMTLLALFISGTPHV